jgi:hypothetical protein
VNSSTDLTGHEKGGYFSVSAGASITMIDPLVAAFNCPTVTNDHEKEVCFNQLPTRTFHGHEKKVCFSLYADANIAMGEMAQSIDASKVLEPAS